MAVEKNSNEVLDTSVESEICYQYIMNERPAVVTNVTNTLKKDRIVPSGCSNPS